MRTIIVENENTPIDFKNLNGERIMLVSELPLVYLQGIRDAEGIEAILIGDGGKEIQLGRDNTPEYTGVDTIEAAVKLVEDADTEIQIASNEQKYFNYKEQHNRLKKALANQFYLEAIFIEYAILEDRFESVLRHGGKWKDPKPGTFISIHQKISKVQKMAEERKSLAHKYFPDELLAEIDNWKDCRNSLIHALLKRNLHTEEIQAVANQGERYVKVMCSKATSFRRAVEKQNKENSKE